MATPRKAAGKKAATKKAATKKAATRKAVGKKATGKKATSARVSGTRAGATEELSLVTKSKVRDLLKQLDMRTDSALVGEVNRRVADMLEAAAGRARENKRSTVRPHDL